MKINNIDIYCFNPDSITTRLVANLSLKDPQSLNSYRVKAIAGLDADEISSKFYGTTYMTNKKTFTMSVGKRVVEMQIELCPKYSAGETVSGLRDNFYKAISSSRVGDVHLVFKWNNEQVARLNGYVAKLESDNFNESPEIKFAVTCPDPFFVSPNEVEINVEPFGMESFLVNDSKSTAPHGFSFEIAFTGPCSKFVISEPLTYDWKFEVKPGFITSGVDGFIIGDRLAFSSVPGKRDLKLIRDSKDYHIIDRISPGGIWPILFPGANSFAIEGTFFDWNWMRHNETYWGV